MSVPVSKALASYLHEHHGAPKVAENADDETRSNVCSMYLGEALADGELTTEKFTELSEMEDTEMSTTVTPEKLFGSGSKIRSKAPSEMYSKERAIGKHTRSGLPVLNERGEQQTLPSQASYAKTGALIKMLAYRSGLQSARLSEHEELLLAETCADDVWSGDLDGEYCKFIHARGGNSIKALIDDATSGGLEFAPIHFDDDIISTPQLHGELYPYVDKKEVARGRRVEGGAIANFSVGSGPVDGSQMSLFTTTALASSLDTTIFNCTAAIEVGRDFLSDAACDVGRLVTTEIGQSMLAWLDEQIALGDGTTEPEGVMVATGTTAVAFSNATSIGNYESLLFSVPKAQRPKNNPSVRFCATETSYQRARAVAVGAADDRRIFGMTHEDFMLLNRPYAISTDLSNRQLFFGDLSKYRIYKRLGMSIETHTQGDYLGRRNLALIVARMRIGGRVMLPSSFGVVTDAPA